MAHPFHDAVVQNKEVKRKPVEVGGQTVYIRKLKGRDARDARAWADKGDPAIHDYVWWVIVGLCDETGQKIFNWSDAEHINEGMDIEDIVFLHDELMAFNSKRTVEDTAKNS